LLVQPDDPEVGAEIKHLSQIELLVGDGDRLARSFHIYLRHHSSDNRLNGSLPWISI
jgi:hypothetical protein